MCLVFTMSYMEMVVEVVEVVETTPPLPQRQRDFGGLGGVGHPTSRDAPERAVRRPGGRGGGD
jgi:hypothetical protein